jgi:hypothetical protein
METAPLDQNGREGIIALLNTDGETITRVCADPTNNNGLCVDDNTTGTDQGGDVNTLDDNSRPILFAESSDGDGTLVPLYVDADGLLLIDSN